MGNDRDTIRRIAETSRTWAVVGCSPDPSRASNGVAEFLLARGYRVIPVNPQAGCEEILGQRCYPDLASIGEPVDVVVMDACPKIEFPGLTLRRTG